jgi:hypothetical protein
MKYSIVFIVLTVVFIFWMLEKESKLPLSASHVWVFPYIHLSYNSNKLTNQMQQFYKFITWLLCRSTCFGHLHAHHQEPTTAFTASGFTLERGGSNVISRGQAYQDHD